MKRVLLLCVAFLLFVTSKAQILNEIMSTPSKCNSGGGGAEFFEIFGQTGAPSVDLDCYALVAYFERNVGTSNNQVIERGFYVVDLPKTAIKPYPDGKWWYTVAGQIDFCIGSNINYKAFDSWNSETVKVKEFLYNSSTGTYSDKVVVVHDLFMDLDNLNTYKHNAMLFTTKGGMPATLVNGIFTATKPFTNFPLVGEFNSGMPPDLKEAISCGGALFDITFSNLSGPAVEYTQAVDGVGNGYFRVSDGLCGDWKKSAKSEDHTPGFGSAGATSTETYTISQEGQIMCPIAPDPYQVTIKFNYSSGNPYPIEYYIIKDDGDNVLEPSPADTYYGPTTVNSSDAPNNTITIKFPNSQDGDRYFVRARSVAGCFFATQGFVMPSCSPQPVTFSNFHAQRNKQSVTLKWETASEQNNRGFNVQRNTRGVWETVAFIFSGADGGNSDELLSYEYKDANSEKGVSQYRIQQVDMDGKASYSAIRSVKGLEQAATRTVVYPNPSSDGKVSVVFEDQGAKAVTVSDMSGRIIRQFRNVLNNVQIEGLESGMYSIQVTDLSSAVSTTEKVIIKKR